jgi:sulfur-oxidizing protein SoxB
MIPTWSFGIREDDVRANVEKARREGAQLVVLLSHNGFDVDRKLAARVPGIDVILPAIPTTRCPSRCASARPCSSPPAVTASSSRASISTCRAGGARRPLQAHSAVCRRDRARPEMAAAIAKARAPFATELAREVGRTGSLLYRRGNFAGSFDDLICAAILEERDAEIALSPGFRWGTSVLPGAPITVEDIHNATAITYPQVYRMTHDRRAAEGHPRGRRRQSVQPDPYYQQGGDMVRCGGLGYTIDIGKPMGSRISGSRI